MKSEPFFVFDNGAELLQHLDAVLPQEGTMDKIKVIVLSEKDGNDYYLYSVANLKAIIQERFDNSYYDEGVKFERITALLDTGSEEAMVRFLRSRKNYEYEGFDIITPKEKFIVSTESDDEYDDDEDDDE